MRSKKAQTGNEAVMVLALIVLVFIIVFGIVFDQNIKLRKDKIWLENREDCLKVAQGINSAFLHNTSITFKLRHNATIYNNHNNANYTRIITMEDSTTCTFIGNASSTNLNFGYITIVKQDDYVSVQNV